MTTNTLERLSGAHRKEFDKAHELARTGTGEPLAVLDGRFDTENEVAN